MLGVVLAGEEVEGLVGDDRSADAAGDIVALQIVVLATGEVGAAGALVAKEPAAIAVDGIGAAAADNVDRSGRGDGGGDVQVRLRNLKLLDRVLGDVLGSGADVLIGDIQTVERDARRTAEAAAEGDGEEAVLGGVEVGAVLDLHARLELGEIEEVAPVDGQRLNLFLGQHAGDLGLLSVDTDGIGGDFHALGSAAHAQLDIAVGGDADGDVHGLFRGGESVRHDTDGVTARRQGAGGVAAAGGDVQRLLQPRAWLGHDHLCSRNRGSRGVGHCALDAARCDGGLAVGGRGGERDGANDQCCQGENAGGSRDLQPIFLHAIRIQGDCLRMTMQLRRHVAYQF